MRVVNKNLKDRLQFLKNREVELMGLIQKKMQEAEKQAKKEEKITKKAK